MRTLKKTLCLVLCLAMMAGLCVFATADFKDQEKIENEEAVAVLTGIGVIQGDDKGNFNPEGTLTRAEATVIITKVLDAADIKATTDAFTDVAADYWGMPYIAYCVAEGVVAGNGDGTFAPNAKLTGYAWATMLLRALGYEISGETWQIDVAKLVKSLELADGITFVGTEPINRDDACQMAFNAIKYTTEVKMGYAVIDNSDPSNQVTIGYYDTMIEAATAAKVLGADFIYSTTAVETDTDSILSETFNCERNVVIDGIGFEGYKWFINADGKGTYDADKDTYVSDFIMTDTVVGTYTKADSYKTVSDDLKATADYTAKAYKNGAAIADESVTYNSTTKVLSDSSKTLTVVKRGTNVVFLYEEETLAFANKGAKITSGTDKGKYNWNFKNTSGTVVLTVVAATDAYKAGTGYLVKVKSDSKALSIVEAETLIGKITATATSYVRVDGTKYNKANNTVVASTSSSATKTIYLNTAGDVMYVGDYSANNTVTYDGYAYVTNLEYIATAKSSTGLIEEGADAEIIAKAKIVTAAGETRTVDVATRINEDDDKPQYYLGGYQNATTSGSVVSVDGSALSKWFGYVVEDGAYKFDAIVESTVSGATAKGASFTMGSETYYLNTNTVISFIDYNTDSKKVETTTVTGYTKITAAIAAQMNVSNSTVVVTADKDKVVSAITYYGTTVSGTTYNFAVYAGKGEDSVDGQYYNFYVNGELKSYLLNTGVSIAADVSEGDIVNFEVNAAGKVTEADKVETSGNVTLTEDVTVKAVSSDGTYFINGSNTVVKLAETYSIFDGTDGYAVVEELVASETMRITTVAVDGEVTMIVITTPNND